MGCSKEEELIIQVDRKQRFFQVPDLHFPHWENPDRPLTDTVIDGELIIDIDPKTGQVSRVESSRISALMGSAETDQFSTICDITLLTVW